MRSALKTILIILLCCFATPLFFSFEKAPTSIYKPKKWKSLGKRKVGFGHDKDEIKVGKDEGTFNRIKLEVKEGAIILKSIEVFFADGNSKNYRIRQTLKDGESTEDLELPGNDRVITRIELAYETSDLFKNQARIEVFGK